MQIPAFYKQIYSKQTKNLMDKLLRECQICSGVGHILLPGNMFKNCQCIEKFLRLKKYTNQGINVKHIHREDEWFVQNFTQKTCTMLFDFKLNLEDILKVSFLLYPSRKDLWGASHIGNQIIKYCIDIGKQCAVVSSKSIMDMFFAWDKPDIGECKDYLEKVDVLLIDEFGTEYNAKMKDSNSYVANSFNGFLLERKRNNKATIVASNFHAKELKTTYAAEIHKVIVENFVGVSISSKTKRKSEFDGISVKIQKPQIRSHFDDLQFDTQKPRWKTKK